MSDFADFLEIQTQTAWGKTLIDFVDWSLVPGENITLTLDIGTGPGLLPALLSTRRSLLAIGLDTDYSLLHAAPKNIPVTQAPAEHLPFPPATFDMVTATNVIFLINDPLRALRECHRILKPGCSLCLLNPSERLTVLAADTLADARGLTGKNRESLLNWAARAEKHGGWSESRARELHTRAGFQLIETVTRVGPGFARYTRAQRLA
jgi:ubiquinone/menaquinone biosynthesis C-methylase UbiE